MKHSQQIPVIGGRIPFYSVLAVLWCMQPYPDTTLRMAAKRSIGTLVGAVYGLLFILLGIPSQIPAYLTACVFIIPVIYTCVLLHKQNAAFFSCVVFLKHSLTHSFDEAPYLFVLNRVLDTWIGIVIGIAVNSFRLPEKHDRDTLYVCGIDSVLLTDHPYNVPYSKVELNRLIGNGVLLYHIAECRCLAYEALPADSAKQAERIISTHGLHCFVTVLLDETLPTYYSKFNNDAERSYYQEHQKSPYCHFVRKQFRMHIPVNRFCV